MLTDEKVLVCVPNWLGDTIMGMVAIQQFMNIYSEISLTILVKEHLFSLWEMFPGKVNILSYKPTVTGTLNISKKIKEEAFDICYVMPPSLRSALIPAIAGIPQRIGLKGHSRPLLLTWIANCDESVCKHQVYEYMCLFGIENSSLPANYPVLNVPQDIIEQVSCKFKITPESRNAVIFPGAERGPSKRWPEEYFARICKYLHSYGFNVFLCGSSKERKLCDFISSLSSSTTNLAGLTTIKEISAIISMAKIVIGNDSGGVHLAAALNIPVVVIFGVTDPEKTKPLGKNVKIITIENIVHSYKISRKSKFATKVLKSIKPEKVEEAIASILAVNKN